MEPSPICSVIGFKGEKGFRRERIEARKFQNAATILFMGD
jgi:hypothetical protein